MKPAFRTITYLVYSANYTPGNGYFLETKSFDEAKKLANKFGIGAEIWRQIKKGHRNGSGSSTTNPRDVWIMK